MFLPDPAQHLDLPQLGDNLLSTKRRPFGMANSPSRLNSLISPGSERAGQVSARSGLVSSRGRRLHVPALRSGRRDFIVLDRGLGAPAQPMPDGIPAWTSSDDRRGQMRLSLSPEVPVSATSAGGH